jgi:uncharacterized protein (DUF1501 family)
MKVTRRQFVKGGMAAFTVTFAAPEFLSDLARAQGAHTRNLVILYLGGGNDSLSMLPPTTIRPTRRAGRRLPCPLAGAEIVPIPRTWRSASIRD